MDAPLHLLCNGHELPEPTWVVPGVVSDPLEVAKWLLVAHMRRECPHAYVGTVVAMRWVVSTGREGYRVWALFDDIHNLPLYHVVEQEITSEAPQQGAASDPARDGEGSHDGAGCDEARHDEARGGDARPPGTHHDRGRQHGAAGVSADPGGSAGRRGGVEAA